MKLSQIVKEEPTKEITIPTMEAISFQYNDPFLPNLEVIVKEYMELVKAGTSAKLIEGDKDLKERFAKLVQDRLGLKTYLITDSHLAATMPNTYVRHSSVVRRAMIGYFTDSDPSASGQTLINVKEDGAELGTVNVHTAKVTGWFSEQPVPVFVNFIDLMDTADFTSGEITAIIAHELGHVFEGVAQCARINTTNHVIADVAKHITKGRENIDTKFVYRELRKLDPHLEQETVDGLVSKDNIVYGISMYRVFEGCLKSLSGSETYNDNSFEVMADSFATRFGYGDQIATGLSKLFNNPVQNILGVMVEYAMAASFIGTLLRIVNLLRVIGKVSPDKIVVSLIISCMSLYTLYRLKSTSKGDAAYDDNRARIKRIRQNIIESLKDNRIDKATRVATLEQIDTLDAVLGRTFDIPSPLRIAFDTIFVGDRRARASINAQKQIEKLIANDLFIKAAKLGS